MKSLYIIKNGTNNYSIDRGDDSASGEVIMTMRKTTFGWNIECTELDHWDSTKDTTFFWVAATAREAFEDCKHYVRYLERRRAVLKRNVVIKRA